MDLPGGFKFIVTLHHGVVDDKPSIRGLNKLEESIMDCQIPHTIWVKAALE